MPFVIRSFQSGRLIGRVGVCDAREARRQVARLIAEPFASPDRVTVWRTGEAMSRQIVDVRLDIDEDYLYNDGILTISDKDRGE